MRAVPFFGALDRLELARLVGALEEVKRGPNEVIFEEASEPEGLYLVERGRVRVWVRTPAGERIITEIGAGGYFGEMGLLLAHRTASVSTCTEVTLWKLPRDRFEELVGQAPTLGLRIAASLAALLDQRSRESVGAPVNAWDPSLLAGRDRGAGAFGRSRLVMLAICLAVPLLLWWMPAPEGLTARGWHVLSIVIGAALAWLLEPLPDFAVTLLMAGAWGAADLAPVPSILGGFASAAWVLALAALALAAAMVRSGLLFRASLAVLRRFPANYQGQVLALLVGGLLITPVVPLAIGRVAAIGAFTKELARGLGYRDRSPGAAGLALAGIVGYAAFSSIFLTGLAMNFFVLDLLPEAERADTTWLSWLLRAAPMGSVLLVGSALVLLAVFRPDTSGSARHVEHQHYVLGPLSWHEKVTIGALTVMVAGFLLQSLFQLNPAWVAIGAVVLAVGGGSLDRELIRRAVDWGFLLEFGILLGAGDVLRASDVDDWIAARLLSVLGDWDAGPVVLLLAALVVLCRLVIPWIPATLLLSLALVPMAFDLGLHSWVVGFVVLVTANAWLLPAQSDYCRVARDPSGTAAFDPRQALIVGAAMTVLTLVGLAVSIPYWRALGLL